MHDLPRRERSARESDAALDSAFRRRWTWRTRLRVRVLGVVGALVLSLVYATLRVRWIDPAEVGERRSRGERFVFASWHDGLVLLPIALRYAPTTFAPRVLISWHRDAEVAAQAGRWFGVRFIRGSSTRGGIGAVRGLLAAHRAGEDVVVVPDGPRGPRHRVKAGVVQLGRACGAPIVPIGVAATPCRRLRSWDRLQVPFPFARVAIRVGEPVSMDGGDIGALQARVERALASTVAAAEQALERPA